MRKSAGCFALFALWILGATPMAAQEFSSTVVFREAGFPAADSASPTAAQLEKLFRGAHFAPAEQLGEQLRLEGTRLLVLPYGSTFPESAWAEIFAFLRRGGNLLVLGGRPFTRAAYRDASGWRLREYSVRCTRPLLIDQYQSTPGSEGLEFRSNPDVPLRLPRFAWQRAFSPIMHLSAVDLYHRGGSAGSIDARLDPLAWGVKDERRMAAPALEVDHLQNGFDGGRWIFLSAELAPDFYNGAESANLVRALAERALRGSEDFTVRPTVPLYLPGEPVEIKILWRAAQEGKAPLKARIVTLPEAQPEKRSVTTVNVPSQEPIVLPAPGEKGFHIIEAELLEGSEVRAAYRSGYWIRDEEYLRSGPRLGVNRDYFELDGRPLAVVGTTYMASDVQRLFFEHPNAYVWDRDLAQIRAAGLNMVRTGWWTGWDKFGDENGEPYERTLRTLEAYLMTARKHGIPVQFNFFAFLPEVLGGTNAYLDPQAVRKQQTLVAAVVTRFREAPFVAWDLINEPSFSKFLWTMRPNHDPIELARWNQWLSGRYADRAALAAAWNVPPGSVEGTVALPEEVDFNPRGMYNGRNSLKRHDYFLFAQESFAEWVRGMREKIRTTGSRQPITVGQDEGGFVDRLSPAFFGRYVDFTTNHSWWQNDALLWDSLVAKQPGQAMLIQETGLQRELNLDETARLTPEQEGAIFERKFATSFIEGSGAIEWLWNTNSYMTEGNETPIGALRADGTEKPEATVLRNFAAFSKPLAEHLRRPQTGQVAIVTSQAAQFSALANLQIEAQQNAVRALAYNAHLMPYVMAENQIEKLGTPKLAILPSPQTLNESTWQALLKYVNDGGNLLVTGPVSRDEHWRWVDRAASVKLNARTAPLTYHDASMELNGRRIALTFGQEKQSALEALRFEDGSTFWEGVHGKGKIFWTAYPVELAEENEAAAEVYGYVAGRVGVAAPYELETPVPAGVLVYPMSLEDSVLYVFVSETAEDTPIALRDKRTGVQLKLALPAQHAALALIGEQQKAVIARYGF